MISSTSYILLQGQEGHQGQWIYKTYKYAVFFRSEGGFESNSIIKCIL